MKKLINICFSLLLMASLAACNQEEITDETTGIRISLKDFQYEVSTRTVPSELEKPLVENFQLNITNASSGYQAYGGSYVDRLIPLDEGTYMVTATYGKKDEMGIDAPAYEGSDRVSVELRKRSYVELTCSVANALLSVKVKNPALFKANYTSYKIGVRAGSNYMSNSDFNKSIYFPANTPFKVVFEGQLKGTNEKVSKDLTHGAIPTSCRTGEHVILTLTASNVVPDIHKVEVRKEEIKATIPVDWLPKPRIQAEAGFEANTLTFTETETKEASVKLQIAASLQEMRMKFNFADEALAAYNAKEYFLSNAADKAQLEALGIVLPEIGATTATVDLKGLTAKLQTNAGETTANTVELDAQANNRWSSEDAEANRTFTLNCNKPEFNVTILPGDIWTKEFTVSPLASDNVIKGNFDKLKTDIVYQYSENNSDWNNLKDALKQTGLQPGKVYHVRAVYRGAITSNSLEIRMNPADHSLDTGLETWSYEQLVGKNLFGRPYDYPWKRWFLNNNKDDKTEGWCSLNSLTTRDESNLAYCSNSGTEPTSDKHSGSKAAEIKTIGWGSGTTAAKPISVIKNVTPGELFLGKMNNAHQAEYGYHKFMSRPTALRFYYQYKPKGSHQFMVEIALYAGEERVAYNTFNGGAQGSYTEHTLNFDYDESKKHLVVDRIHIRFNSGDNSKDEVDEASVSSSSRHTGNRLYVDDISLVYDK